MELYHVSCNKYSVDQILTINQETYYYSNKKDNGINWVDDFLDICKPAYAPERSKTLYAFDFIGNCSAFWGQRQCENGESNYYKVSMKNPIKAPMCLIDLILKFRGTDKERQIANEYWNPTKNWLFYEYLSCEMKVVQIMEAPNFILTSQGKNNYLHDLDLRKQY